MSVPTPHDVVVSATVPIGEASTWSAALTERSVALAAAVVIGLFELLDAAARSGPVAAGPEDAELEGPASVAGLLEVAVLLGVGALIARPIRRRLGGVLQ